MSKPADIRIITPQSLANGAAEVWKKNYYKPKLGWVWTAMQKNSNRVIYAELVALGPTPTPAQVAAVIGNDSWTSCRCHLCNEYVDQVAVLPEICDNYYSVHLCATCITAIQAAINTYNNSNKGNLKS